MTAAASARSGEGGAAVRVAGLALLLLLLGAAAGVAFNAEAQRGWRLP